MISAIPAYGLDPDGGERLEWGDIEILVKASAAATGGALTLFEEPNLSR